MAYNVGGQACCVLEICCGGEHQIEEFAEQLDKEAGLNREQAKRVAAFILETYDLAPVGTLRDFKRAIAKLAREYPPEPGY